MLIVGLFGFVIQQLIAGLIKAEQQKRTAGAYEIHDDLIQNLTVAQLALALDDPARAVEAIDHTLDVAQQIVSDLLQARSATEPGDLVRAATAPNADPSAATSEPETARERIGQFLSMNAKRNSRPFVKSQ